MQSNNHSRFYSGRSMKGTFLNGDRLVLEQVSINELNKGDVIVFKGLNFYGSEKDLVHRIVSISDKGVVTKGDNNFYNDTNLVSQDNFVGRVTHIRRKWQKIQVKNGKSGLRRAEILHTKLYIKKTIWEICRFPYNKLKKSELIPKIWKPNIKKIYIKTPEGELIKYIHGKRTVGRVWTKERRYKFKKPYDLVIKC